MKNKLGIFSFGKPMWCGPAEMEYCVTAWSQGKGQKLRKGYDSVPGGLGPHRLHPLLTNSPWILLVLSFLVWCDLLGSFSSEFKFCFTTPSIPSGCCCCRCAQAARLEVHPQNSSNLKQPFVAATEHHLLYQQKLSPLYQIHESMDSFQTC